MPTTFRIHGKPVTHYYPEENAQHFGLSRRTVIRRLTSGRWPGVRIGLTYYMTDADRDDAYDRERERTARRQASAPDSPSEQRPRLGLAIAPEDADRLEGLS